MTTSYYTNPLIVHHIHKGDRLQPLVAQLVRRTDAAPQGAAVDLTGKTVTIDIYDSTGTAVVSGASCTVTDATAGKVSYAWSSAATATAGTYFGYFRVTSGGLIDSFPVDKQRFIIVVHDN